jgi:hypothetical protein
MHPDLACTNYPSGFGGNNQQAKVDYAKKQHRIWYIVLEKPYHRTLPPIMSDFLTAKSKVSLNFTLLLQHNGTKAFFGI